MATATLQYTIERERGRRVRSRKKIEEEELNDRTCEAGVNEGKMIIYISAILPAFFPVAFWENIEHKFLLNNK